MKKTLIALFLLPSLGACSVQDNYYNDNLYPAYPDGAVALRSGPFPSARDHRHAVPVPPPVIEHGHRIPRPHAPVVVQAPVVHSRTVNPYPQPSVTIRQSNRSHGHD